jgi:hypothetical protein
VGIFAVLAEALAVVRSRHNQAGIVERALLEGIEKFAYGVIGVSNLAVIGFSG